MSLVNVKYYKRDCVVGFRDGAYFESEEDSKESETGKEYTAYWLVDCEGNRAPENIYIELMKSHSATKNK